MNKLFPTSWSMVVVMMGVLLMTSVGGSAGAAGGPEITETYRGGPLVVKIGEKTTLNLRDPASGGYSIVTPVFDARILKLLSTKHLPPTPTPVPRMGDFGRIVYEFQAIGVGETELAIQIARPWEKTQPPEEYLKVKVKVGP